MSNRRPKRTRSDATIGWLPVDSRLVLPLFSFGHVKGWARVFLEIEIVLSVSVVVGTLALFILKIAS